MANKRMFTMKIVDTDAFLDMPLSTQCLYFHLNMRADDDGFIGNAKRIMKIIGASEDDLKLLILKSFVLTFEEGVIVIKHWRMHNTLSAQRYHETQYLDEKSSLLLKKNGSYSFTEGKAIDDTKTVEMFKNSDRRTNGEQTENADLDLGLDLDKDLDKGKKKKQKHKYGEYSHVLLTDEEKEKLFAEYGESETKKAITFLDEYIEMKGYKAKNHYLCMKKWVFKAVKEEAERNVYQYKDNSCSIVDKWEKA